MASFELTAEEHYLKSCNVFRAKSGETVKSLELLQQHMPPLLEWVLPESKQLNILSVGSGEGSMDVIILKIIKEELKKSDQSRNTKMFNRAIEPSVFSCGRYRATVEHLPTPLDDQQTKFEICQQTFEEYQEIHKEPIRFDIVHFMHSIYYVNKEQTLLRCFERDLKDKGRVVCLVSDQDLQYRVFSKQKKRRCNENVDSKRDKRAEKLIRISSANGWKYEVYTQEYSIDVTEVFDPNSTEGNLLLDFLTYTVNLRETADKQLVEETLALIKDLTIVRDGKRFGEKKDFLVVIYKN